jgi:hypothetical protein
MQRLITIAAIIPVVIPANITDKEIVLQYVKTD